MPHRFDRLNDGSNAAPRLRMHQTVWSMSRLPMNAATEWTLDEKFARARDAGFESIEARLTDENEGPITTAINAAGLGLVMVHTPFTVQDTRDAVNRAVRLGAQFIFCQPANAYHPLDKVVELVTEGRKIANDNGLCYFVETHRNNFTETIGATLALLDRVPDIRFTADLSHFVVVGEFYGWESEGAAEKMRPILERTSHMHGRISNGQAVQVDVGDGTGQTPQFFVSLWEIVLRSWRSGAGPGDIFPFASELGPPRYAITLPDGSEYSDRWEQSLVIKRLAEQAWSQAASD